MMRLMNSYIIRIVACLVLLTGDFKLSAQTIINTGTISGTWSKKSSPYLVKGDVNIPAGKTLTIQSGVTVKFDGLYMINVQGSIVAEGKENDSIIFTVSDTTGIKVRNKYGWNGIRFDRRPMSWDTLKFKMPVDEDLKKIIETRIKNNDLDTATKISLVMKIPDLVNDNLIADSVFSSKLGSRLAYCRFEYTTSESKEQPFVFGGAVYIYRYSNLVISNCLFENNFAFAGGAIYCKEAAPVIINNRIIKCKAHSSGGAMVFVHSGPVIMNNIINDNTSGYNGGAVLFYESSPYVLNNIFMRNKAENSGGAIYCEQNVNSLLLAGKYSPVAKIKFQRDLTFDKVNINSITLKNTNSYYGRFINNLISENKAVTGGGMALYATAPEFTNITLSGNKADNKGGGIYCDLSSPQLINSILYENVTEQVFLVGECQPVFRYCNIESGISGVRKDSTCKNTFDYSNISNSNPKLKSQTGSNYSLDAGSDCIDAGTPDTASLRLPTIDLSGKNRIINGRIDLGALEYNGSKTIKSTEENQTEYKEISSENSEMYTSVFPNPNSGMFSVVIHNNIYESITMEIISQAGQTVYINNFKTDKWFEKQIDLSDYANGIYLVVIHSDDVLLYNGEIIIK
jgi:predicted outer membrane repeat protein